MTLDFETLRALMAFGLGGEVVVVEIDLFA
jgi:hypothetical protein